MNRSGKAIMKIKLSFLLVLPVISLTSYGADYGFRTYERVPLLAAMQMNRT